MDAPSDIPEKLASDRYRVEDRVLVCLQGEREIRRIPFDSIRGWCDTGQGAVLTLSIVMKEGRSVDLLDASGDLEEILSQQFPDTSHSW